MDRNSTEYKELKAERAEVVWRAIERVIPDVRSRVEVELVGTPLTQERFVRRHRGSYGPAYLPGKWPGACVHPFKYCTGVPLLRRTARPLYSPCLAVKTARRLLYSGTVLELERWKDGLCTGRGMV